jgi:hypothetical protein
MKHPIRLMPAARFAAPAAARRERRRPDRAQVHFEVHVDSVRPAAPAVGIYMPVLVPVLVPVFAAGSPRPSRWQRVWERVQRVFGVVVMVIGFYSALAGLQWAPKPPGVFPTSKATRAAFSTRGTPGRSAAKRRIR